MTHPARYRPYRFALWVAYFVIALSFVGSIIYGGITGVHREGNKLDVPWMSDAGYSPSPW